MYFIVSVQATHWVFAPVSNLIWNVLELSQSIFAFLYFLLNLGGRHTPCIPKRKRRKAPPVQFLSDCCIIHNSLPFLCLFSSFDFLPCLCSLFLWCLFYFSFSTLDISIFKKRGGNFLLYLVTFSLPSFSFLPWCGGV